MRITVVTVPELTTGAGRGEVSERVHHKLDAGGRIRRKDEIEFIRVSIEELQCSLANLAHTGTREPRWRRIGVWIAVQVAGKIFGDLLDERLRVYLQSSWSITSSAGGILLPW